MVGRGAWMMLVAGALGVAGAAVASANATESRPTRRAAPARGPGSFTPAAADPRLAAMFARGGFDAASFRFTPAGSGRTARAVTVAVRARTATGTSAGTAAAVGNVGIAPIAYSLGASVKWKRLAIAGDVQRLDLAQVPGGRESADVALSYTGNKISGRVKAGADRALPGAPIRLVDQPSYSLDASTSYSLTRNLDVTAGVRYRSDRERLARSTDDRRESQAVYVGTAFRF